MSEVPSTTAPPARVLSTLNADGTRRWLRPRLSRGGYLRARTLVGWVLIAFFIVMPYVEVGGAPAMLFDILGGKFHLFGATFLATDTRFLMLFLLAIFLGIFLVTALAGRVWCGWACPQTVYLEFVFRPIERWLEGSRQRQLELDRRGPDLRRLLKFPIYLVIAAFVAHTFLAYFVGVDQLLAWVRTSPAEHPLAFAVMIGVTLLMFFDFAYFREQTCIVACPYGRLQAALLDKSSVIVGYDAARGEPRGRGVKRLAEAATKAGDCVDCRLCVETCPTGIDIRDGLQMECIGCTQCIDACAPVMARLGKAPGLIRYTTLAELQGRRPKIVRARVIIYALALLGVLAALVTTLSAHRGTELVIVRAPGAPFAFLPSGAISNSVRLKIENATPERRTYRAEVTGASELAFLSGEMPVVVEPGEIGHASGFVTAPATAFVHGECEITIVISDDRGESTAGRFVLLGPRRGDR